MSTFKVECRPIAKVWNHPNADRLDLAQLEGLEFQFVVGRDQYKVGDDVVYFPLDSMIPNELVDWMGLTGRLSGKKQNIVRTAKLRGEISQGIVASLNDINGYIQSNSMLYIEDPAYDGGVNLAETLGVEKYEAPDIPCQNGTLKPLPEGVGVYDIEGIERHSNIVEMLMDIPCVITEKLEGSNWSLTISNGGNVFVNQRNYTIEEAENSEHMFWRVAREQGLIELAKDIKDKLVASQVTLRGEFIGNGVQKNHYELNKHEVRLFDVKVDDRYMDADDVFARLDDDILVPVLNWDASKREYTTLREWLDGRTIAEASTGTSKLIDKLREGIVIKPRYEMYEPHFGRVIIKKRSPEYLAETGN